MAKQTYKLQMRTFTMKHFTNLRFVAVICVMMSMLTVSAQKRPGGFDPKRFDAELEQFITTNACLSPQEAAKFFPVYRQMMKKMRGLFDEMRRWHHVDLHDVNACADAIRKQDEIDIELKQLQQEYHARFMLVLPANKVMSVIKAEEKFHRQAFRRMKK